MRAKEVYEYGQCSGNKYRRGNVARQLDKFEFDNPIGRVIIHTEAPFNIKRDGTYPKKEGWIELHGELQFAGNPYTTTDIWVKTATKGGRRRTWVRST